MDIVTGRESKALKIDGKDYRLVEFDGAQRSKYLQELHANAERVGDGYRPRDMNALDELIISLCLRDGAGNPVPIETVRTWSGKAIEAVASAAERLNGLAKEDKEEAKND